MNALSRLWHELTRPRGPVRHIFYRSRRRSRSGVALLIVLTSVMFLTVMVTDIAFNASVRLQLAAHSRDEAKAEAIATSGVRMYQLILVASKAIGKNPMIAQVSTMLGLNLGDSLWQMVPFLNTGMMRMIFVTDGDVDEVAPEGLTDDQVAESRESTGLDRNFLDFDGDFDATVTDEDRKINITTFTATNRTELQTDPTALKMYGMMSGMRSCPDPYAAAGMGTSYAQAERDDLDKFFYDRNLERWELIGNIADWTDADNTRVYDGGGEDSLYNNLERFPYLPKNAGFDTLDEVRLVEGWQRDDVWDKFGENLTVYGNGKVNINTAECDVMWALLKSYITPMPADAEVFRIMDAIQQQKVLFSFSDTAAFVTFLTNQGVTVDPKLKQAISTESRVFRVTSSGQVGDSVVTIDAVIDFSKNRLGKVVYWRVR